VGLRVSGPFPTDDMLAVALLICFAATLFWIQCNTPSRLPLGAIVVALELLGIYFTFFRGAFIAVLAIIVLGLGLRPRKYARLFTVAGVVAALAVVAALQVSPSSGLSQRLNNGQNISGRLATYREGYAIFSAHPFFGVGVGQFSVAQTGVLPTSVNGVQAVDTAHSSYVDTLAEQGLWGLLPLLALTVAVALLVRSLIVSATNRVDVVFAACLAAAALAYLLMSMELTTVLISTDNLFLAVMLGAGSARVDALAPPSPKKGLLGR
jgi:O-antigen ligase